MRADPRFGFSGLEGFKGFAAAIDRGHIGREQGFDLRVASNGGLAVIGSSFGVAKNDPVHADFLKHRDGDFAGVGAMVMLVDVLSGDNELLVRVFDDGLQANKGRGNADVDAVIHGEFNHILGAKGKSLSFRGGLVHFPVAEEEFFSRHDYLPSAMTSMPGRCPSY